jgi:hypothetical protein
LYRHSLGRIFNSLKLLTEFFLNQSINWIQSNILISQAIMRIISIEHHVLDTNTEKQQS